MASSYRTFPSSSVIRIRPISFLKNWEEGLAELNRRDDGIRCEIACGFAFGGEDYDLDEIFQNADEKMYADKKARKGEGNVR